MRSFAVASLFLAACGSASVAPPTAHVARVTPEPDRAPIDPIAALTPEDAGEQSWVVPGPIQLELGATPIAATGSGRPIEVAMIDRQGRLERVAVHLEHARFSVWIARTFLMSVLARDQHISVGGGPAGGSDIEVVLRAGSRVRRLAHRDRSTQIRYLGALQVEGWVPDAALGHRGRARDGTGRIPTGRKTLMVVPGAVIRSEPRWTSGELAIMANGYFLDAIRELDDSWSEVGYEDGDVAVHGFVSKRDPPGRVHHWHDVDPVPVVAPNATVASGTCLFARIDGDAIGYIVGNRPVELEEAGHGWWLATLDTPWGPIGFAVRGASKTDLVACAPPNTVPPAAPLPP